MLTGIIVTVLPLVASAVHAADTTTDRVATVMNTPGCVALWDLVKREPDGAHRFTAHAPAGATNDFALDAGKHIKDYTPAHDGTGGPFTIGRVIHSSRGVGFTGWICGVAVFNRALSAEELGKLSAFNRAPVILPSPAK